MKRVTTPVLSLITLTTDFGTRDVYVAAMKGVILGIAPEARLVDISHEVTPQDVMEAAFVLREAFPHFPSGAIHLVVVDPGVGTERLPIALSLNNHIFVGPDNGLFALLLEERPPDALVQLDRPEFWLTEAPSNTFHGRDLFAAVAGHLAAGRSLADVGSPIESIRRLHWAMPIADSEGIRGWVVHIDRFGNCITNVARRQFSDYAGRRVKGYVGNAILEGLYPTYGAVEKGDPLLLFGSSDRLEIAVNGGNAAELLSIQKGAQINVLFPNHMPSQSGTS